AVAALFGAPVSGYDIRRAMDEGRIVLACPGAGGLQQNRLVANLLVYDLLHAALTRAELPPEKRRLFFAFVDEAQTCDGASNGNLAALLEQASKFMVRLFLFNQDPERLTARTWSAIKTNRSHLLTTVVSAEAAVMLARQWGGDVHPATITRLPRFSYVASVTLVREISRPFLVQGVPVSEMWGDCHHPELLEEVDGPARRTPVVPAAPRCWPGWTAMTSAPRPSWAPTSPSVRAASPTSRRTFRLLEGQPMPPSLVLSTLAAEALELLYQHRLLST